MSATYTSISEFFLLGKSLKSHGTSGGLRLMIEDQYKGYVKMGQYIFFELSGSKVPFRITQVEDGNHYVIFLENISNKKESDNLGGLELWIPLDLVKSRHQRSPKNIPGKWHEYQIHDSQTNSFHKIERVEEFPQQMMAVIEVNEKEILIPLSDHLITSIDKDKKIIYMDLPEGLMEL